MSRKHGWVGAIGWILRIVDEEGVFGESEGEWLSGGGDIFFSGEPRRFVVDLCCWTSAGNASYENELESLSSYTFVVAQVEPEKGVPTSSGRQIHTGPSGKMDHGVLHGTRTHRLS